MNSPSFSVRFWWEGYPRHIIQRDGEAPMVARANAACHVVMITAEGTEVIREQVSEGQLAGDGLAEGAAREVKAKVGTIRHAAESGIGRAIHTGVS